MASSSSSSPEISAISQLPLFTRPPESKYATLDQALDDLSSRFILNLPDEELNSLERICFQVEQAHWFYEDFIREANPALPSLPLKKFSETLFSSCPLLHQWSGDHEGAFSHFMQYKTRVPVCGAIMLNDTWDKVVLVKGWKASAGWGFPKGKINESEERHACAIREVLEETGYNLAGQLNPDDVIEVSIREQQVTLFIVPNVPESYPFETKTRKEISKIDWFKLSDLPTWRRNNKSPGSKFYLITPFIGALKAFISKRKPRHLHGRRNGRNDIHRMSQEHAPYEESNSFVANANRSCTTQEESSQASSVDTTDPQTPSPLYSEPVVHTTNDIIHSDLQTGTSISADKLDPHFARLLTGLTLSATASVNSNGIPAAPTGAVSPKSMIGASTPVQPSTMIINDPENRSVYSPSSSAHPTTHNDGELVRPMMQETSGGPIEAECLNHTQSPLPNSLSPVPSPSLHSSRNIAPRAPSTSSKSPSFLNLATKSFPAADMSPHSSRSSDQSVTGKRLKQLALLESVVDESSRMAPVHGQRTLQATFPITHSDAFLQLSAPQNPPFPPSNSASLLNVLPHNLYQHTPQDTFAAQTIYQTLPNIRPPDSAPQDDVFTIRPRTSNNFRPITVSTQRPFGSRASMSQAQLTGMLATAPTSGIPLVSPSLTPTMPLSIFHPRSNASAALRTTSPMKYMNGHTNMRSSTASAVSLLSILNNRGPHTVTMDHNAYNRQSDTSPR